MKVEHSKAGCSFRLIMFLGAALSILAIISLFSGEFSLFFVLLIFSGIIYFGARGLLWIKTGEVQDIKWFYSPKDREK